MAEFPFQIKIKGVDDISGTLKHVRDQVQATSKSLVKLGQDLTLKVSAPLATVGTIAVREAGKIEQLEIAFETMTGSADNAKKIIGDLRKFATATPFELNGIAQSARQLLAFGTSQEDVIPRLTTLGDIAAGTGSRLEDLAAAYGRIQTKQKATLEDINKFLERGVPVIDFIAKKYSLSTAEVFKAISQGEISFQLFDEALQGIRIEKFANLMEKQSKSIFGLFSTFKDQTIEALAEFGFELTKTLNLKEILAELTEGVKALTEAFLALPQPVKEMVIKFGLVATLLGPVITAIGFLGFGIAGIASGMGVLGKALAGLNLPGLAAMFGRLAGFVTKFAGPLAIWGTAILIAWKPLMGFFQGLFEGIKEGFEESGVEFGILLKIIIWGFKKLGDVFNFISEIMERMTPFFKELGRFIGKYLLAPIIQVLGFATGLVGPKPFDVGQNNGLAGPVQEFNTQEVTFSNKPSGQDPGRVVVDFSNVPRGTEIKQEKRSSVLQEVNVGYSFAGL